MRQLFVIGIGVGNLDHLTVQAIAALRQLDVVFVLDKGEAKSELVGLRKLICERYLHDKPYRVVELRDPVRDPSIADYEARVEHWHEQRAQLYEQALLRELGEHQNAGILVWGDPSLYDSTLRLIERLKRRAHVPFTHTVIPGITSVSALAASHRLALHRIAGSLLITTGRNLRDHGWPAHCDAVVVMLDGECSFRALAEPEKLEIYWGAYLGTADELLIAGALAQTSAQVVRERAAARARHGWIMDIYLLRKISHAA